jgi:tetratricopeptide (TPR) repeat protein
MAGFSAGSDTRPEGKTAGPTVRRALNARWLIGTFVVAAVVGAAAYFWHDYQVKRLAAVYLERAGQLEDEGKYLDAARDLSRYLHVYPNKPETLVRLAKTFGKGAASVQDTARAVALYYRAIGVASPTEQMTLRKELAECLLRLREYVSAEREARKVLEGDVSDKDGKRLLALALFGEFLSGSSAAQPEAGVSVTAALEDALELHPGDIQLAQTLAVIYRGRKELLRKEKQILSDAERAEAADAIIDRMVATDPKRPEARLARYRYRLVHKLPNAVDDLQAALELGPNNVQTLLLVAGREYEEGRRLGANPQAAGEAKKHFAEARRHYEHILKDVDPSQAEARARLGEIRLAEGDGEGAIEIWRKGLDKSTNPAVSRSLNRMIADTLIRRGRVDEAAPQLEAIDRLTDQIVRLRTDEQARTLRTRLKREDDVLRARWLVRKGDYAPAERLLRDLASDQQGSLTDGGEVWSLLGRCHAGLNQPDEAAKAYEKVLLLQPDAPGIHLAAAEAWKAAGQPAAAIPHYQRVLRGAPPTASPLSTEVWLSLAAVLLQREIGLPANDRNWSEFEKALAKAKPSGDAQSMGDPWRASFLEAHYALARVVDESDRDAGIRRAAEILRDAEKRYGDSPKLLTALVAAYERLGLCPEADRVLKQYEGTAPDSVEACVLRASLHHFRKESDKARQVIEAGLAKLPPKSHVALRHTLVQLDLAEGKNEEARRKLAAILDETPDDVGALRQLAVLALECDDFEAARRWEERLQTVEGPSGWFWQYCRARRLLNEAKDASDPGVIEAAAILQNLLNRQSSWPDAHLLAAVVLEVQGKTEEAIGEYLAAIRLGARRLPIYRHLVPLLYRARRFDEAERYLSQMKSEIPGSAELSKLEIELAGRSGEYERALEAARRGVKQRPDDAIAQIWLGQVLQGSGRRDEAEAAFKKAVELSPKEMAPRDVLLRFYLGAGKTDLAEAALRDLVANVTLTEARQAQVLARGYELLADRKDAEAGRADAAKALAKYREAAKLAPKDVDVHVGLARLLMKTDPDAAAKELREFLREVPDARPAMRDLVAILSLSGGEANWGEAQQWLGRLGTNADASGMDARFHARALARRGGKENLAKAQGLVRELIDKAPSPADADRVFLAELYDADAKSRLAREQYAAVVSVAAPDKGYLSRYVDLLLKQREWDEAALRLKKLEEIAPNEPGTVSRRACLLSKLGQADKIESLVETLAAKLLADAAKAEGADRKKRMEVEAATTIGGIFAMAEQPQAAEKWFRRLAGLEPSRYAPLAMSLAKLGRMKEAIAVCAEATKSDASTLPAVVAATLLTMSKPSDVDFQAADALFAASLEKHSDDAELLFSVATVRVLQKRLDDAVAIYQRLLKSQPNNPGVLNNLATTLAEMPGRGAEALECVDRAIGHVGPRPDLLDTKGTILLLEGKADQALPLLEEAAGASASDPRSLLHLAMAYDRIGKAEEAARATAKARERGVEEQILTENEKKWLAQLNGKFPPAKSSKRPT